VLQRTNVKSNRAIRAAGMFVDCNVKDYKNQYKKNDAWQKISFHIGIDVDIVEKKIKSLLAQYRRERRKVADAMKSGSADDVNVPKRFAYKRFAFFGWNQQANRNKGIDGNFIYCYRFSVTGVLYGHFEPSNSRQQFKIRCSHSCNISKPTSIFHLNVCKHSCPRTCFKQGLYPPSFAYVSAFLLHYSLQ
jgi:hypothetical protein